MWFNITDCASIVIEPTQRDKLQLIKSRSHQGSEGSSPVQGPGEALPEYNHVLLLCPRDAKPAVVVIEKKQPLPQQSVKAYIIDSGEQMTLVSVRGPTKTSWLLIRECDRFIYELYTADYFR